MIVLIHIEVIDFTISYDPILVVTITHRIPQNEVLLFTGFGIIFVLQTGHLFLALHTTLALMLLAIASARGQ